MLMNIVVCDVLMEPILQTHEFLVYAGKAFADDCVHVMHLCYDFVLGFHYCLLVFAIIPPEESGYNKKEGKDLDDSANVSTVGEDVR